MSRFCRDSDLSFERIEKEARGYLAHITSNGFEFSDIQIDDYEGSGAITFELVDASQDRGLNNPITYHNPPVGLRLAHRFRFCVYYDKSVNAWEDSLIEGIKQHIHRVFNLPPIPEVACYPQLARVLNSVWPCSVQVDEDQVDEEADRRATDLLTSFLSEEQVRSYNKAKSFECTGNVTGQRYKLSHHLQGNITLVGDNRLGIDTKRLCVVCEEMIPIADQLLAQFLMITCDEQRFLEKARYLG